MSLGVRDGKFDVVIAAGPRLENWPSVGVKALSLCCAEMGLTVGQFGGEFVTVRGVIPLPGTGGIVLIEDLQRRLHRIQARAVVRISAPSTLPDPFTGWCSQGMIPIATAERLLNESQVLWNPITVVLGTGNRALRFASNLLETTDSIAVCVETYAQWGAKRFAGWEVERRRLEMLGGRIIEAKPIQLSPIGPLLWQLRLQDQQGIRILEVGRVVSAGPFSHTPSVREHPPGSFLFEFEQTAAHTAAENVEGWTLEEESAKWLAGKIVKNLVTELGSRRESLDQIFRRARGRIRRHAKHREIPFTPTYEGKWITIRDRKMMKAFGGVPKRAQLNRLVASIECFEDIPCTICQTVCPTSAIQIGRVARSKNEILSESACTACGICLSACPSESISMIRENEQLSTSQIVLPWHGRKLWAAGETCILLNRRGESLGTARVNKIFDENSETGKRNAGSPRRPVTQLLQIEVPSHLAWEARAIKRPRPPESTDQNFLASLDRLSHTSFVEEKVEITLNGTRRLVRDRTTISVALFEIGQSRPEDIFYCKDGSCGRCYLSVDSVKKAACQTKIRKGMAIRTLDEVEQTKSENLMCPCLGIPQEQILERLKQGNLQSPEAVLSATHIGEGKCHGQLCMGGLKRVLADQGLPMAQWIDWRFPWSDWILSHNETATKTFQYLNSPNPANPSGGNDSHDE